MRGGPTAARRVALAVLAVAAALVGCSGGGAIAKAGGPQRPLELVLTNHDGGGDLEPTPAMAWFVERAREVSGGRLVVRVEPGEWATDGREVAAVASGRADLGWVGTRAFDLLGVDHFRPLHVPLLVDGYRLLAEVVQGEVAERALSGLAELGVAPLGLIADELRFPASVDRPLLSPEDWAGARVWLLESGAYADAVEALGGVPLHTFASGGDIRQMIQEGDADGLESMWAYYTLGADYLYSPYVVPNLSLGPRTLALFANPGALARLAPAERAWLDQAVADTVAWAAAHAADRVPASLEVACQHGARVALASPAELAALAEAVSPLRDELRARPATAPVLAALEALAPSVPPDEPLAVPEACRYQRGEEVGRAARPRALLGPGPTGDFPDGTYRYEVDPADMVRGQDIFARPETAGVFTWAMAGGEWLATTRPAAAGVAPVRCRGWYAVEGDVVHFTYLVEPDPLLPHCTPLVWSARWEVDDRGAVTWHPPVPAVLTPHQAGVTWARVS